MSGFASGLYAGTVVHKRLAPRLHGFSYRVFALALNVDELDELDGRLRLFSRGRTNLVSFWDRDLGDSTEASVGDKARRVLASAGLSSCGAHITLVCYPRLLGFVFNPLSVYFCRDAQGHLGAVVYEVSNTFGERKSYVIEVAGHLRPGDRTSITQSCTKELYVSPFTAPQGSYGFHIVPPEERVVIGVNFREQGRPVLKTHFRGERLALTDRTLAAMVARHPMMTLKIVAAIHVEAARLWAKGVPLEHRHTSPVYSVTVIKPARQEALHA